VSLSLNVNGAQHTVEADASTPLLYVLRDELGLNGAKYGCGLALCGACTVQIDGEPAFSCVTPIGSLAGKHIRTVEGLGTVAAPNALQAAFEAEQAAQCGYCIAGMLMRAQALLDHNPAPTEAQIRAYLQPNLCRCGTHMRILRAVQRAARTLGSAGLPPR
jgi:aerobic-type carbon monoxide dehydrogenase small subunit (CoxS/CutS family)